MTDTFLPAVNPSYGSSVKIVNRTLTAQLGDGYTVRAGDGLNARIRVWSLQWDVLNVTAADAIEAFLILQEGYKAFYWTPPRGLIGKWICKEWNREPLGVTDDTITTTFEEVFDL